jgi:serine/threonine-protein phosphatase 4 regulatory subunit 1
MASHFQVFAGDSSASVRGAVAESLPPLSLALSEHARSIFVMPILSVLLEDDDESVRQALIKEFGPLIASIGQIVDASVIEKFGQALTSDDPTIAFSAAFSLPAVALMLGTERWAELQADFVLASHSRETNVRRTISFGLISYAFLIPPAILTPVVISFLRDIPVVAVGALSNLFQLIRFLEPNTDVLFCLRDPFFQYPEWRMRLHVSQQIRYCAEDLNPSDLFQIACELVRDPTAIVRKDAALSFAHLINAGGLNALEELTMDRCHLFRQVAALSCSRLLRHNPEWAIRPLLTLIKDPVANVRIVAGQAIFELSDVIKGNDELNAVMLAMKDDPDPDVRHLVEIYV